MVIRATADLHGTLPEIEPCDLLLIGGDICPVWEDHDFQNQWYFLEHKFKPWLAGIDAKKIVGIAGNHDFIFQRRPPGWLTDEGIKTAQDVLDKLNLPWTYLQDSQTDFEGLTIYGTPWVPNLPSWAFCGGMNSKVDAEHWDKIPDQVDILLSHGPFYGFGDRVKGASGIGSPGDPHVGCKNMLKRLMDIEVGVFVCGHIHEGFGFYRHSRVEHGVYNVALNDELYDPVNPVVEITL